ncbi:MAG TPA: glucose-6-phosphate dehydrogenase assembly protein OpcA [Planctomycetota bacterium]|nr:glucose-6-phosphate dehydrogenase assembly protein OpcA [Planctomycetota bacterium]
MRLDSVADLMSDFLSGVSIPVDPERIDRELAKLWEPDEAPEGEAAAVTRHTLSNIVFLLPCSGCPEAARDLVLGVGRRFPSRIIILGRMAAAPQGPSLAAYITAVCHAARPGSPRVCCEQITLEARSGEWDVFPGAVAALLVPDVPASLVLLHEEEAALEPLLDLVDRVVFDSRGLPLEALSKPLSILERETSVNVDDLAWRGIRGWRRVLCDIFDEPRARPLLATLARIEVVHGPGGAASGALLAGWLASRIERTPRVELRASAAPSSGSRLASVHLEGGAGMGTAFLTVKKAEGARVVRIEYHTEDVCVIPRTVPHEEENDAELLGGALERTTHQGVLHGALRAACGSATASRESSGRQ